MAACCINCIAAVASAVAASAISAAEGSALTGASAATFMGGWARSAIETRQHPAQRLFRRNQAGSGENDIASRRKMAA